MSLEELYQSVVDLWMSVKYTDKTGVSVDTLNTNGLYVCDTDIPAEFTQAIVKVTTHNSNSNISQQASDYEGKNHSFQFRISTDNGTTWGAWETDAVLLTTMSLVNDTPLVDRASGFDRIDKTTLPILEFCSFDATAYTRIYFNGTKMVSLEETGATHFSNGEPLALRTIAICDNPANNAYYMHEGVKYEIADILPSRLTAQAADASGGHVAYLTGDTLLIAHNPNRAAVRAVITRFVVVSIFTLNVEHSELLLFADEMHGFMDGETHAHLHLTTGCQFGYGLSIFGLANNGTTYTSISEGEASDEDLDFRVEASAEHRFFYREGIAGHWRQLPKDSNIGYKVAGEVVYNHYDESTGAWSLRDIDTDESGSSDSGYIVMHWLLTNDGREPSLSRIVKIIGQHHYTNRTEARNHLAAEINDLETNGLPIPEMVWLYSAIIHNKSNGQIETGADGEIYVDHRFGTHDSRY